MFQLHKFNFTFYLLPFLLFNNKSFYFFYKRNNAVFITMLSLLYFLSIFYNNKFWAISYQAFYFKRKKIYIKKYFKNCFQFLVFGIKKKRKNSLKAIFITIYILLLEINIWSKCIPVCSVPTLFTLDKNNSIFSWHSALL